MSNFSIRIKEERKKRGWNQRELARRANLSQPAIKKIEDGGGILLTNAITLAKVFGLPLGNYSVPEFSQNVKRARGFQTQYKAAEGNRKLMQAINRCEEENDVLLSTAIMVAKQLRMTDVLKLLYEE